MKKKKAKKVAQKNPKRLPDISVSNCNFQGVVWDKQSVSLLEDTIEAMNRDAATRGRIVELILASHEKIGPLLKIDGSEFERHLVNFDNLGG